MRSKQLDALISFTRRFDAKGWTPATSSNFSLRTDANTIAITRSGRHKGLLSPADFMQLGLDGEPRDQGIPSAEAQLHLLLYNNFPAAAVLHTHSPIATVMSMAATTGAIQFAGYEMLKAFAGVQTHSVELALAVYDNSQDIAVLADCIAPELTQLQLPAFLIRGHGVYTWGESLDSAVRHLEALEFLLECEWLRRTTR